MISLYDTMTKAVRTFQPADPSRVTLYVCGPTVYAEPHLGNARPAVVFDVLFRVLREQYGESAVHYASNYTDIDDKIMARSKETGVPIDELTAQVIADFETVSQGLNILPPTYRPRATRTIPEMVGMIRRLIETQHAYAVGGHVFFSVKSHVGHGCLSGQITEEHQDAVRIEASSLKRDPEDFVLWKPSTDHQPGWLSPWGVGRPGWHIECSAMIAATLGKTIDIHGGGVDLVFPHHEAEIAQSESYTGEKLAETWMHNGMVTVLGRKMSKSAGNFIGLKEAISTYGYCGGEVLRYLLLMGHYRQPIDFSWEKLADAKTALDSLYRAIDHPATSLGEPTHVVRDRLHRDLNTAEAIAAMHGLSNTVLQGSATSSTHADLIAGGNLLGILQHKPDDWFGRSFAAGEVHDLIAQRQIARDTRDWAEADRLRQEIAKFGYTVEDRSTGTTWRWS